MKMQEMREKTKILIKHDYLFETDVFTTNLIRFLVGQNVECCQGVVASDLTS